MNTLQPVEPPMNQYPLDVTSTLPDQVGGSDNPDSWQEREIPPAEEPSAPTEFKSCRVEVEVE